MFLLKFNFDLLLFLVLLLNKNFGISRNLLLLFHCAHTTFQDASSNDPSSVFCPQAPAVPTGNRPPPPHQLLQKSQDYLFI